MIKSLQPLRRPPVTFIFSIIFFLLIASPSLLSAKKEKHFGSTQDGGCKALTIANLEKICTLDYDKLENYLNGLGFYIIKTDKELTIVFAACKNRQEDRIFIDVNEEARTSSLSLAHITALKRQLKIAGYKLESQTRNFIDYTNGKYFVSFFLSEDKGTTVKVRKEYPLGKSEKVDPPSIAKRVNSNTIEISSYTNSTNITIRKNDKVYLSASGEITYGAWAGSGGPTGIDGFTNYNKIQGFRHGSLLVRVGNSSPWKATGDATSFTATSAGNLQFVVNDADPSNNSGVFVVNYSINKPLPVQETESRLKTNPIPISPPTPVTAPVVKPSGFKKVQIQGSWTLNYTSWSFGCNMEIEVDASNNVSGTVNWKFIKADPSAANEYRGKQNATAKEFVRGTYDPDTKTMRFQGTSKSDPSNIIALDQYEIKLLDNSLVDGKTRASGNWSGLIRGTYSLY